MTSALLIFLFTYLAIAGQKIPGLHLDRPSGALLGAVLMVWAGVLTRSQALAAVNFDTILLLLGMMVLAGYLAEAAFFRWCAWWAVRAARTPRGLLLGVVAVSGTLSALLVNDTVCLMLTPLLLRVTEDTDLDPLPFLLALATASNVGSAATLTGNPQNMLVGTLSGWPYAAFAVRMVPVAGGGLLLTWAVLRWTFRRALPRAPFAPRAAPPPLDRALFATATGVTALVLVGFLAGWSLPGTAMSGAALLLAAGRRPPARILARVDWTLLLFFCGLFAVVEGLNRSGWGAWFLSALLPRAGADPLGSAAALSAVTVLLSNLVSNVPAVLLVSSWIPQLPEPNRCWLLLAMASTFAGNLTVVGSVANLIVAEGARAAGVPLRFRDFLRVGVPITVLTTVWGFGVIWLLP